MNPTGIGIDILKKFWDAHSREIIYGYVARIETHDTAKMRADITPLLLVTAKGKSPVPYAVISDVPVGFMYAGGFVIRPKYKKGNLVWVSAATFSIEKALSGSLDRTDGRVFSIENSCILHGVSGKTFVPPSDFDSDGLIICNESGTTRFVLNDDTITMKAAKVKIDADIELKGKISQTGDFETSGDVKTEKDVTWKSKSTPTHASTHIHGTGVGPSSKATPGS